MNGKVKFYNVRKGFGFVTGEDGKDYFVHRTSIPSGIMLYENSPVSFDAVETDRGVQAQNIQLLKEEDTPATKEAAPEETPVEEQPTEEAATEEQEAPAQEEPKEE